MCWKQRKQYINIFIYIYKNIYVLEAILYIFIRIYIYIYTYICMAVCLAELPACRFLIALRRKSIWSFNTLEATLADAERPLCCLCFRFWALKVKTLLTVSRIKVYTQHHHHSCHIKTTDQAVFLLSPKAIKSRFTAKNGNCHWACVPTLVLQVPCVYKGGGQRVVYTIQWLLYHCITQPARLLKTINGKHFQFINLASKRSLPSPRLIPTSSSSSSPSKSHFFPRILFPPTGPLHDIIRRSNKHTHMHTHTHTHTHTHKHTHTHTDTHTHAYTATHTHTHTQCIFSIYPAALLLAKYDVANLS